MKYKAIMIDVDGTLIPNRRDGMPSKKVREAISKASKLLHVGVASSRPIFLLDHIFDHLKLSGPSIINGGAQIIDVTSRKIFYKQPIDREDVGRVYKITKAFHVSLLADTEGKEVLVTDDSPTDVVYGMFVGALDKETLERLRKRIDAIPTVSVHIAPSWTKGKWTISVCHAKATKQHAIFEVAKILNIDTHEIIAIGDGGNDLPLLMACGLRVAMGNAVEELKDIADYIAPSVDKDGVAHVIEKFILN